MKIVMISGYYNHHQSAFSACLQKRCDEYCFVETNAMSDTRKKFGYGCLESPAYLKKEHDSKKINIEKYVQSPNIIIQSGLKKRIKQPLGAIVFVYSERIYKTGIDEWKHLFRIIESLKNRIVYRKAYLLCASAFAAYDYKYTYQFINRMYKWGYFPDTFHYDIDKLIEGKKKNMILWCGRFLEWKHPEDAMAIAQKLKCANYDFKLCFIGKGEADDTIEVFMKKKANDYKLTDSIEFWGAMTPQLVRKCMETAGIFIFTSDSHEGWGAVLNESMNSGCAVVASHAIGAVPYLMKHKENGLIYESRNIDALYNNIKYLLDHPEEQCRLGKAAYRTITEEWNAEVAAERFVNLAQHVLDGERYPDLYESGPCSRAEIIHDDWFKNAD